MLICCFLIIISYKWKESTLVSKCPTVRFLQHDNHLIYLEMRGFYSSFIKRMRKRMFVYIFLFITTYNRNCLILQKFHIICN